MYRIGKSTDIHQFVEGRKLILGGVHIDHPFGLLGHSDADALLHAVTESIIGALGIGDLGTHFSDQDPKYKNIASTKLLENIYELMCNLGFEVVNLDSTIIIEEPMMRPYVLRMKANIAKILNVSEEVINVKATRGEKLGFVGNKEGIIAEAVVLLRKKDK